MFYDVYTNLCAKKGISESKAAESIGLNRSAVAKWKKGAVPGGKTMQKLADYFGVTTDYLLGSETEKAPTPEGERQISDREIMVALWGRTDEVDEKDLADVQKYADYILERKRKK